MRIDRFLCLAAFTLPLVLGGCADTLSGLRAVYGGELWGAENSVATSYDLGKRHFADGRYGLAVQQFETAVAQNPGSVESLNGLAATFDRLRRFDQAERLYLRALALQPDSAHILNNLGYSYLIQGKYRLAMAYLSDAQALDSTNPMIAHNYQKSKAALNLETRAFVAASIQAERETQLARAAEAATVGDAAPVPAETETQTAGVETETEPVVRIVALGGSLGTWVERTSAAVQTLITRPHPEVYLAIRDASVAPALANYRRKSALGALETQPTPWQGTRAAGLSAAAEPPEVATVTRPHDVTPVTEISVAEISVAEVSAAYVPVDEAPLTPPGSEETPLVEISNGTGRLRMALRVGGFLEDSGFAIGRLSNAEHFRHQQTIVYYRGSWLEQARWISAALPVGAKLEAAPDQTADIRIRLGGDLLNFDRELFLADRKSSSAPTG